MKASRERTFKLGEDHMVILNFSEIDVVQKEASVEFTVF